MKSRIKENQITNPSNSLLSTINTTSFSKRPNFFSTSANFTKTPFLEKYKINPEKFTPTKASVKFWETYFDRFEEVTLIDYINALVPILEEETTRRFTDNQLLYFLDVLNYENKFKITRLESHFFIDVVWNDKNIQKKIWNDKYISVERKVEEFVKTREKKKDEIMKKSIFSSASMVSLMMQNMKLKDCLGPLERLKVPSHRVNTFYLHCIRGIEFQSDFLRKNIIYQGSSLKFDNKNVFFDNSLVKQKTKTQFSGYFKNHSRIFVGINDKCDIMFEPDDITMSNYHLYFEKNHNLMYMQDFSRFNRAKIRLEKLPYLLDFDMVIELGNSKCRVKKLYPKPMKPKRCNELLYIETRDATWPFRDIFNGELGRTYGYDEVKYAPVSLKNFMDVYTRKCDFLMQEDIQKMKLNPSVELEFFEGPMKGETWKIEKNLNYQLKILGKSGNLPKVKDKFYIGKSIKSDYILKEYQARDNQCVISFNEVNGWCIEDENWHVELGSTYLHLANYRQYLEGKPSRLIKVYKDMILVTGEYEFSWKVMNYNPDKPENDIYDSDDSLFLVEDENDISNFTKKDKKKKRAYDE